jgi:hypothetical protein
MPYNAPVSQIADTLARIGRLDELAATGAFPNFDADLVAPIRMKPTSWRAMCSRR